jgi:predicted kinase
MFTKIFINWHGLRWRRLQYLAEETIKMRKLKYKNTIIIITGCPGTGKSYWAERIRKGIYGIRILSYDEIKENFFDLFGFNNFMEKEILNGKSLDEFYQTIDLEMKKGGPILIEYPFYERHRGTIINLIEKYYYYAITLYLHGDMQVIYQRSVKRDSSGCRHPGHLLNCYHKGTAPVFADVCPEVMLTYDEFVSSCQKKNYDVQIGKTISLDISDLTAIDSRAEKILDKIASSW